MEKVGALVDTSLFVAAERGQLELHSFAERYADTGLFLAAITVSELLHGVHRLRASKRRLRAESFVETILTRVPVLAFDVVCARAHARLGADLARRGITIGAHDLMITATAVVHGLTILTSDRRSFEKVAEVRCELC